MSNIYVTMCDYAMANGCAEDCIHNKPNVTVGMLGVGGSCPIFYSRRIEIVKAKTVDPNIIFKSKKGKNFDWFRS